MLLLLSNHGFSTPAKGVPIIFYTFFVCPAICGGENGVILSIFFANIAFLSDFMYNEDGK